MEQLDDANFTPAKAGSLSVEQVGNIVFNETRSLSGPGIDAARRDTASTIMNADETWGPLRPQFARTAPSSLPSNLSPLEQRMLTSIREIVAQVRALRSSGIDPTHGATSFNLRAYPSAKPPWWGPTLRLRAIHGPFANTIAPPQYIHIWQNPNARHSFYAF